MTIGTLHAKILLEEPGKVYCGSGDPVTGNIKITFVPNKKLNSQTDPELFGPLKVSVRLHGRAKTKIWKKSGQHHHLYRGRASLFERCVLIYDDPFKSHPNDNHVFPFEVSFPETIESHAYSSWESDPRFGPDIALPPSFNSSNWGLYTRYESFVEYRVGVDIIMPGLKIDISRPEKYDEPMVRYERERLSDATDDKKVQLPGYVSVNNELLLAEEDRPSSFKQKAKGKAMAVFKSDYYPKYAFDWKVVGPRNLFRNQAMEFKVHIKPDEKECTAVVVPEVQLYSFIVEVVAHTSVRAERALFVSPEASNASTVAFFQGMIEDNGPFKKANDWTKLVKTGPVVGVPSTFRTFNIARAYSVQIKLVFSLAGKEKDSNTTYAVTMYPPLMLAESEAGPSQATVARSFGQQAEVTDLAHTLPRYERPPEYDEAEEDEQPGLPAMSDGTVKTVAPT